MPRRTHAVLDVTDSTRRSHELQDKLVDELLKQQSPSDDLTGPNGLIKSLVGRLLSRAMAAEMTAHLGYAPGEKPAATQGNRRNGATSKQLRTDVGEVELTVPRDRDGSFEPMIVPKHARQFDGFDEKIISMYARGMSVRDIRAHLQEIYGVDVGHDLISRVTDAVLDELRSWQSRALESVYLVVYVDAMFVKMRDKGVVANHAVYQAIGVTPEGHKEVLGLWVQKAEGAKFWLSIFSELRQRGVEDILVLCADGLTGMAEAAEAAFPSAIFQTCIVHMIRSSMRFVPWKERKDVCASLREVYMAPSLADAEAALDAFEVQWGDRYPMVVESWRRRWAEITPFLAYPPELRKVIYTTNTIEASNRQVRKVIKSRGHFPDETSALKLIYLALRNAAKNWGPSPTWTRALRQFAVYFADRLPMQA